MGEKRYALSDSVAGIALWQPDICAIPGTDAESKPTGQGGSTGNDATPELRPIMKSLVWTIVLLVMVLGFSGAGIALSDPDPQQPTLNMDSMSVAELEKAGDEARATKNYEQALDYFRTAIRKDKKNAVLHNKLGLALLKAGKNSEARASFQKSMKLNSKYPEAVNNIGAVYFVDRNMGQAARYFKKAVALDESRPAFHVNLGAAWFGQNKLERAMTEYRRALQLDPEALSRTSNAGVAAQINTTEERARYDYMMAKIYYHNIGNVYKDEEFSQLRQDQRLSEIVPPPEAK
ncbi:MAG: hypothetical protein DMG81_19680 [Acidobacteria bacterium]|nr:MAG: hypothetical protein DMG81_19680 [Acidobacteriota bacterium]